MFRTLGLALLLMLSQYAFSDKYYDRNQLPQLSQEILQDSKFAFTLTTVPTDSIIPVQTQRVHNLVDHEKRLINAGRDSYRPLVIDRDGYLIDGHHRLDSLQQLAVAEARVLRVDATIEEVVEEFPQHQDHTPTYEPEAPMEEVVVTGTRSSLLSAIGKQEVADNLISVVDSDAIGNFPDSTAADAVRRLSGISVENDQGEGRYITIRGLSSDLNSVAVNGASMVAPENGRSVIMDGIPTELLDSITVAKSLTPEMDADSIGGRVEFNTKKPTELEDTLFKVKLATKWNDKDGKKMPNASIVYGDFVGDIFAHVIGLTFSSKQIISHNNETGFGWEDGKMNDDYEMRWYDVERERYGLSYDFAIDGHNITFFGNALYNQYDEAETRFKNEYGKIKWTDTVIENGVETSRIRHDVETRQRYETRKIGAVSMGFETKGALIIDGKIFHSFAQEDDSDNADITFRNYDKEFGGRIDWGNPRRPIVTPYSPTLREPRFLEFDAFEMWANISDDSESGVELNAETETSFGTLKTGVKFRSREKQVDDYIIAYTWDGKTLADFESTSPDWIWSEQTFGTHMTGMATYDLRDMTDMMEFDFEDAISRDFTTSEDIFAIYIQDTIDFDRGTVIFGIRYEDTETDSFAYDQDGEVVYAQNRYSFIAPNLTIKYFLTDSVQARFAAWRGLSRPGFKETAPKTSVDIDTSGEVSGSVGNPLLKPYEADNLDLSIEYYGDGMSFASVGVFYKSIDNAIYPTYQTVGTFNGVDFDAGVETWINSPESKVKGIEANLQYGLDNGLYIAANVTYTDSESEFLYEDGASFSTPFRKLADKAANLSIGYDKGPVDIRLAVNYRGDYLDWLADEDGDITNVSENNMRFVSPHMQVDLTAKYKWNDRLTMRFEGVNLNDRDEYYYWGNPNQLSQFDNYGKSYVFGFDFLM